MNPHFPFNLPGCNDYGSSYPQISFGPPTPRMSSSPPLRSLEYPLPSIPKPRDITPPENKPVQENGVNTAKAQPLYEQTLAMIKQLEKECPERPISITLSSRDFQKLMDDLKYSESDQKWPRYSYNALTSKMIVQCMPSPLHQCFSEAFLVAVHRTTADLPPSIDSTITTTSNEDFNEFFEQYEDSEKIPDAAVFLDDINGSTQVKIAMEIGFFENYQDLIQNIRMWLEEAGAAIAILVKIEEASIYGNPARNLDDQEKTEFYSQTPKLKIQDFNIDGEFGPATCKGLQWVGKISSATLEVWKRDSRTGLAIKDRNDIDLLTPRAQFRIKLSEFLPIDPQYDRTISLEAERFHIELKKAIRRFALYRYLKAKNQYEKQLGEDMRDRNYSA